MDKRIHNKYLTRLNNALAFIHNNLHKKINLEDIAKASHFSSYHFHRIFHSLMKETVNDYVNRKRLESAANTLVFKPDLSITNIAHIYGFSSSANFAKSFKLYFGVSPSQLRNPRHTKNSKIGKIHSKYGKAFDPKALYSQFVAEVVKVDSDKLEEMLMNVEIKTLEEKIICSLSSPKGYEPATLFDTWDKIIRWARNNGIADEEQQRFALCYDNPVITPIDKCRYDASIVTNNEQTIQLPFVKSVIPAGQYAIAYYQGKSEKTTNFHIELYSNWLPSSGFEPDNFPLMEHYLNDSRQDGFTEMKVYIKLKKYDASSL